LLPVLLLLLVILMCGCDRATVSYPPPEQRRPIEAQAPAMRASMMVNMNDDDAPSHFVQDISTTLEGSTWRWTKKRPTVKLLLIKTRDLKFVVDFTLPDVTMRQTGPVTISFFVGNRLLDKIHYDKPGYQHYEKAIEPASVQTANETVVSAEIDKIYKDPGDGAMLGFILTRMGFERR
jgi:hypothetical protein